MSVTAQRARTVIPLRELSRADRELAGSKAANLGELARAGFPVPDGFVVIEASNAEVLAAARALGDVPLAVRSSGAAEDLADASFAGQYETILDVRGSDALLQAIVRCRESARRERVQQYRAMRADTAGAVVTPPSEAHTSSGIPCQLGLPPHAYRVNPTMKQPWHVSAE
jgi:phosphoenolpyruvate synthase/pyruvate phosphate dikinase